MKKFIIYSFFILISSFTVFKSQVPRFTKHDVENSGASLYIPGEPKWETTLSEDQSNVYTTEVIFNKVTYGAVVVKFSSPIESIDNVMESYLHHLNDKYFLLTKTTDIGKGHTLEKYPDVKGFLEYGENANGEKFTIKTWGNTKILAVLYIKSKEEVNFNFQEIYFKGFRFP